MAFDITSVLKDVPELDTRREQIEYIRLDLIDGDSGNFYSLSEIESLANNIATIGLQQPLRLRKNPTEEGRYLTVSGHRRREALNLLVKEDPERWTEVACIVQRDSVSPAMQQLRLIFANSDTRKMSSADISEQAVQVEKLLYQLKEEGHEFPGRMRDHVAQVVQVSKSKLARLKVIREGLSEHWLPHYKNDTIVESVAYALAQLSKEWQYFIFESYSGYPKQLTEEAVKEYAKRFNKLSHVKCSFQIDGVCINHNSMMGKSCKERHIDPCSSGCCMRCSNLRTCGQSCTRAAKKKKELRDAEKEAIRSAAERQAERDRPGAEFAKLVYQRIGLARKRSGVSVEALFKVQKKIYSSSIDDPKQEKKEAGEGKFAPNTYLPFGYSLRADIVMKIRDVADALQCSVDYLLGRTDIPDLITDPQPTAENVSNSGTWQTGNPEALGEYILLMAPTPGHRTVEKWEWDGIGWCDWSGAYDPDCDGEILGWIPMPGDQAKSDSWNNESCITGMSPTGHCGAAACCDTEYGCCLQCPESCNSRCGWISEQAEASADE